MEYLIHRNIQFVILLIYNKDLKESIVLLISKYKFCLFIL